MRIIRRGPPWQVPKTPEQTVFVVGEEGQNILAVCKSATAYVPRFVPEHPEQMFVDALVDAYKKTLDEDPKELHVITEGALLGLCLL